MKISPPLNKTKFEMSWNGVQISQLNHASLSYMSTVLKRPEFVHQGSPFSLSLKDYKSFLKSAHYHYHSLF